VAGARPRDARVSDRTKSALPENLESKPDAESLTEEFLGRWDWHWLAIDGSSLASLVVSRLVRSAPAFGNTGLWFTVIIAERLFMRSHTGPDGRMNM
jgi:hypothetical protein